MFRHNRHTLLFHVCILYGVCVWGGVHPIIKALNRPTPNTTLPFPSDVEIRAEFYFGLNTAEFTSRVRENTAYQSHQTARKQKRGAASVRQTPPLVTAFSFHAYHNTGEGGARLHGNIQRWKGGEMQPPCSRLQSAQIKGPRMHFCFRTRHVTRDGPPRSLSPHPHTRAQTVH